MTVYLHPDSTPTPLPPPPSAPQSLVSSLLSAFDSTYSTLLTTLATTHAHLLDTLTRLSTLTHTHSSTLTHLSILEDNLRDLTLELSQQVALTERAIQDRTRVEAVLVAVKGELARAEGKLKAAREEYVKVVT